MAAVAAEALVALVVIIAFGTHAAYHVAVVVLLLLLCRVSSDAAVVSWACLPCVCRCASGFFVGFGGGLGLGKALGEVFHVVVSGFDFHCSFVLHLVYVLQPSFPLRGLFWAAFCQSYFSGHLRC